MQGPEIAAITFERFGFDGTTPSYETTGQPIAGSAELTIVLVRLWPTILLPLRSLVLNWPWFRLKKAKFGGESSPYRRHLRRFESARPPPVADTPSAAVRRPPRVLHMPAAPLIEATRVSAPNPPRCIADYGKADLGISILRRFQ